MNFNENEDFKTKWSHILRRANSLTEEDFTARGVM